MENRLERNRTDRSFLRKEQQRYLGGNFHEIKEKGIEVDDFIILRFFHRCVPLTREWKTSMSALTAGKEEFLRNAACSI